MLRFSFVICSKHRFDRSFRSAVFAALCIFCVTDTRLEMFQFESPTYIYITVAYFVVLLEKLLFLQLQLLIGT